MNRELDGFYFYMQRNGKLEPVFFSDLTEIERQRVLDGKGLEWLKSLCCYLADRLKMTTNQFDTSNSDPLHCVPNEPEKPREEDEHIHKIHERMRMFLSKMKELEAEGYYSGGWDSQTNKTAISKDGKIVGYMDKDLNIEWR